jgi:hypothetical protein
MNEFRFWQCRITSKWWPAAHDHFGIVAGYWPAGLLNEGKSRRTPAKYQSKRIMPFPCFSQIFHIPIILHNVFVIEEQRG